MITFFFKAVWAIPRWAFRMDVKGTVLLRKMKWLQYGGNLLFTILYLWNAELTQLFIKYEITAHASGALWDTLDKHGSWAPQKESRGYDSLQVVAWQVAGQRRVWLPGVRGRATKEKEQVGEESLQPFLILTLNTASDPWTACIPLGICFLVWG